MKKILTFLLLVLSLSLLLAPVALAADLDLVADAVGILTYEEWEVLNKRAEEISEKQQCDVAIVIIDEMSDDDGAYDWAKYVYEEYNFGYGSSKSGLLFFLSMAERDYALIAYGYGNTAFTDHGKDVLLDDYILPLLGNDNYYQAFGVYLNKADEYLTKARAGSPFDLDTDPKYQEEKARGNLPIKLAATILVPLLIALLFCQNWKRQMKTAVIAREADNYIPAGGFVLTGQEDQFLYRTETRTKIEKSSSSSGGTTTDSDGYSGRSGKF